MYYIILVNKLSIFISQIWRPNNTHTLAVRSSSKLNKCSSVVVFLNLSKIYNDFHVNNVTILCCYFGLQNFYSIIHFCLKIYYSHDGQRVWGGGVVKYRYTIHYFAMLLNFLSNIPYTLLPYKEVSMAYYMLNNLSILENQPQGDVLHSWQRLFSSLCF